jgi:O-methyltransferase
MRVQNLWSTAVDAAYIARYFSLPEPIRAIRRHSLLSYLNLFFLQELVRRLDEHHLQGDIVECGVYKGGSAAVMAFQMMRSAVNRHIWLYDAFEGMPTASDKDDQYSHNIQQKFVGSEMLVHRGMARLNIPASRYTVVRGWFNETFPKITPLPVALLHVDCDFYEPVKLSLETFYPQVQPGGFVVLNDYGSFAGCRAATDEFLETSGLRRGDLVQIDQDAYYFRKP